MELIITRSCAVHKRGMVPSMLSEMHTELNYFL